MVRSASYKLDEGIKRVNRRTSCSIERDSKFALKDSDKIYQVNIFDKQPKPIRWLYFRIKPIELLHALSSHSDWNVSWDTGVGVKALEESVVIDLGSRFQFASVRACLGRIDKW
jgi:hypothetical protein